jgi:hypothetical protein
MASDVRTIGEKKRTVRGMEAGHLDPLKIIPEMCLEDLRKTTKK